MNEKNIRLNLLLNRPIRIGGMGYLQLPTLNKIAELGEEEYNKNISALLFSKDILKSDLEELNELTDFHLLINLLYYDIQFREMFFSGLELLFNKKPEITEQGVVYFDEISEETVFTEKHWESIKKIVRIGNYIKEEEKYNAGNERARRLIEQIKKSKEKLAKAKKKDNIDLHSIVSAVSCRVFGFDRVGDLTIYQLYDTFYRLNMVDNYHYTFTGIYSGNISSKDINLSDINWANVIKIN